MVAECEIEMLSIQFRLGGIQSQSRAVAEGVMGANLCLPAGLASIDCHSKLCLPSQTDGY